MSDPEIFPTIHLNGSSPQHLLDQLIEARRSVREATDALVASAPNARDYYPQGPEAFTAARKAHETQQANLNAVLAYLTRQLDAIQAQLDQRRRK